MAKGISGIGDEKALFEMDETFYWVEMADGKVRKVSCARDIPGAVMHSYWLDGTTIMGDSFTDGHGLSQDYKVSRKETPEIVKELLLEKREAVLKRVQGLDSRYGRKKVNS